MPTSSLANSFTSTAALFGRMCIVLQELFTYFVLKQTPTAWKSGPKKSLPKTQELRSQYEKLSPERRLALANAFIDDAGAGRYDHGAASGLLNGGHNQSAFEIYYSEIWAFFIQMCALALMALVLVEPSTTWVCDKSPDISIFTFVSFCAFDPVLVWIHLAELLLISIHVFDAFLRIEHMGPPEFVKKTWNNSLLFVRLLLFVEVCFVLFFSLFGVRFLRLLRFLRAGLLLTRSRELRQLFDLIATTVKDLCQVALLLLTLIFTYSVIGVELFGPEFEGTSVWHSTWTASFELFILLSGDNYPGIMQPSYAMSKWHALFFLSYIIIGVHLVLPLILAVVVDAYKDQQKDQVMKDRVKEKRCLIEAFHLIDQDASNDVTLDEFSKLIRERDSSRSEKEIEYMFNHLDQDHDGRLDTIEFLEVCDALDMCFTEVLENEELDVLIFGYSKELYQKFGTCVSIFNIVLWIFGQPILSSPVFHTVDFFCLSFMAFDIIIKIKLEKQTAKNWHKVNAVTIFCGLIAKLIRLDSGSRNLLTKAIITIGSIRGLGLIEHSQLHGKVTTMLKALPLMKHFAISLFLLFYVYAVVGLELLQLSEIQQTPAEEFVDFNLSLFNWMVGAGLGQVMHTEISGILSFLFFFSFYLIVVLIVLNLFLAIVLDAYAIQESSEGDIVMEVHRHKSGDKVTSSEKDLKNTGTSPRAQYTGEGQQQTGQIPESETRKSEQHVRQRRLSGPSTTLPRMEPEQPEQFGKKKSSSLVQVTRKTRNWKRELLTEQLKSPESKEKELHELKNYTKVDLVKLGQQKFSKIASSLNQLASLKKPSPADPLRKVNPDPSTESPPHNPVNPTAAFAKAFSSLGKPNQFFRRSTEDAVEEQTPPENLSNAPSSESNPNPFDHLGYQPSKEMRGNLFLLQSDVPNQAAEISELRNQATEHHTSKLVEKQPLRSSENEPPKLSETAIDSPEPKTQKNPDQPLENEVLEQTQEASTNETAEQTSSQSHSSSTEAMSPLLFGKQPLFQSLLSSKFSKLRTHDLDEPSSATQESPSSENQTLE